MRTNARLHSCLGFLVSLLLLSAFLPAIDARAAPTPVLFDLLPGTGGSDPGSLVVVGDQILFTASDDAHGSAI